MKNVKFGVFCLGLLSAIGIAVSGLNAQTWVQAEPGRRVEVQRPEVMVLDGRGAQLGVMVSDVDAKATTGGVKIDEVNDDSPAEKAGIKAGDVVVEYDGERVRSARQFTRLVQETPEGRSVAIALLRDGKRQTVNATPETGRMTWNVERSGLRYISDSSMRTKPSIEEPSNMILPSSASPNWRSGTSTFLMTPRMSVN